MVRFAYRFVLLERSKRRKTEEIAKAKRVLLIGGGKAGQIILRDIKTAKELKDIVCCIIDDNPNKWGRYIEGVPIVGGRDDILSCVERYKDRQDHCSSTECYGRGKKRYSEHLQRDGM